MHFSLAAPQEAYGSNPHWLSSGSRPQFAGLEDRLKSHVARVAVHLERPGVEVVNVGLMNSPEKALDAGDAIRQVDVDLIFLSAYTLLSMVLPVVQRACPSSS